MAQSSDDAVVLKLLNETLENEPTGVEIQWSNPATGNQGIVVVTKTVTTPPDRPCREYLRTRGQAAGSVETIEGVGCRITAGMWELEEKTDPSSSEVAARDAKAKPKASSLPACPAIPPDMVLRVPCHRGQPFVAYTLPNKAPY
ncbi:MAG: RT0821/Lpp0805 family surface protein [Geminicoccaceae bacterium]